MNMRCLFLWIGLCGVVTTARATHPAQNVAPMTTMPTVGYALRALDDWQLEVAKSATEILLYLDPNDVDVVRLAAQVQHQRGEHQSALALLQAVQRLTPQSLPNAASHIIASARYAAHFETIDTPHFRIRFLNKDRIVATYAQNVLEKAYARIGEALAFYPAELGEKIAVEIYPDARGLSDATGLTVREIETSGTIAVCKYHRLMITSPLATAAGYEWADTLAHEFVHLVVSKKSHDTIPIWLHEGIAKYHESLWSGDAGRGLSAYSEKLLADAVRSNTLIPFAKMHPSMAKLPSQEQAALAFAEVFSMIEFIRKQFGPTAIPRILDASAQGNSTDAALKAVIGWNLAQLEGAWKQYLRQRPFRIVPGATPTRIVLADEHQPPVDPEKAASLEAIVEKPIHDQARLGELLQLRGHTDAAIVAYEKAYRQAGSRYPTLLQRLARAYVIEERDDDAHKIITSLLISHPESGDAHLMAARLAMRRHDTAVAQKEFEAVIYINPFNPEIYAALEQIEQKLGRTADAKHMRTLFDLANAPRPARDVDKTARAPAAETTVNLVTSRWDTPVQLDNKNTVITPAWGVAVAPGKHQTTYTSMNEPPKTQAWTAAAGQHTTILLK